MLIHLHRHVSALSKQLFPTPSGVCGGQPTRAAALWSHPPPSPPLTHTISVGFINRNQTCILERIIIIIQAHTPSHAHPEVLFYLIISRFASLDDLNQFFFFQPPLFLHLREVGEGGKGLPFGHPLLIFGGWECHQGRKRWCSRKWRCGEDAAVGNPVKLC